MYRFRESWPLFHDEVSFANLCDKLVDDYNVGYHVSQRDTWKLNLR